MGNLLCRGIHSSANDTPATLLASTRHPLVGLQDIQERIRNGLGRDICELLALRVSLQSIGKHIVGPCKRAGNSPALTRKTRPQHPKPQNPTLVTLSFLASEGTFFKGIMLWYKGKSEFQSNTRPVGRRIPRVGCLVQDASKVKESTGLCCAAIHLQAAIEECS